MINSLDILKKLLPRIEEFNSEETEKSVESFAKFLLKNKKEDDLTLSADSAISTMKVHQNVNAQIAFHVARLNKYAKYYIKEAFKNTLLSKADDFAFLATIIQFGAINKTQLIAHNVCEVPAGMDVIKRLVKNDLVNEQVNKNDRRIKMLEATEKGREVLFGAMHQMSTVGEIVGGKLTDDEKKDLLVILEKLDQFHERIYLENKTYDLMHIKEGYL